MMSSTPGERVTLGAIITTISLCYLYRRQEYLRLRVYLVPEEANDSYSSPEKAAQGGSPQGSLQLEGNTGGQNSSQALLDHEVELFDLNESSATLDFRATKGPLTFPLRTDSFNLDRDETPEEMPYEFRKDRPHEYPAGCSSGSFPRREQASLFEPPGEMLQPFFEGAALAQAFVKTFQSLKIIPQTNGHSQVRDFKAQDVLSFEDSENIKLHYPHKPICIFATGECADSFQTKTNGVQRGGWGTCAVVGNSEDLLSVRRGAQIDSHDTVIRFGSILKLISRRNVGGVKSSERGMKPAKDISTGRDGNSFAKGRTHKAFVGIAIPPTGENDPEIQTVVGNKTDVLVLQDRFITLDSLRNSHSFRSSNTTARHIVLDGGLGHHVHSQLRERALHYKFKAGNIISSIFKTAKVTRPISKEKIGPISNLMEFVLSLLLAEICTQIDVFGFDIREESLAFWYIHHIEGVKLGKIVDYGLDEDPGMHRLSKAGLIALHQIMRAHSGLCLFA